VFTVTFAASPSKRYAQQFSSVIQCFAHTEREVQFKQEAAESGKEIELKVVSEPSSDDTTTWQ
jgi:hypothetical protein